ncbi:MAG: rhodanese-like domain-containing protein [Opitutae bacterium]|nr:rhodanese-like domain-containing protein [Opitutae bacterium]
MNWLLLLPAGIAAFFIIRLLRLARPGISLEAAMTALKDGKAVLVDIREPAEWAGGVAKTAALVPFSDLHGPREQWSAFLEKHRGKQLLLYCASGSRSGLAASLLRKEGRDAINVGTLRDWNRAGWPICTPRGLR